MNIADLRREYTYSGLSRADLSENPLELFAKWFEQARSHLPYIENAMTLATANADGMPSVRTLLLKHVDEHGFVFFTDYSSQKGQDLAQNPQAALLFQWLEFDRQIIVQGDVEKTSRQESASYFASRPKGSQLAAYVSQQSQAVESREALMASVAEAEQQFAGHDVTLPDTWGGYRLKASRIEFWQGRPNRLHDRFAYQLVQGEWVIQRLSP